jgi:hypothetical protein
MTNEIRIRVSATIANEWCSRGIHEVIPDLPDYSIAGGVLQVSPAVAQEVLADCKFNGDSREGPEEMPRGCRRAYRALAEQVQGALAPALQDQPNAKAPSKSDDGA